MFLPSLPPHSHSPLPSLQGGRIHGEGHIWWSNGDQYYGHWEEGRMCGQGKKIIANGDAYFGGWKDDVAVGYGRKTFACGDVHEGYYFNDKRHGKGAYYWVAGDRYEGDWVHGVMTGYGIKVSRACSRCLVSWCNLLSASHPSRSLPPGPLSIPSLCRP